jgi:hypothetical protein
MAGSRPAGRAPVHFLAQSALLDAAEALPGYRNDR